MTKNIKIEAGIENLKKILVDDEKFYQIPDYQRPYSWDKENLSELIDDLITAYIENKDDTYFCGSLVLVNNNVDERFDIIDGQQRTTTFTIMSCVFRDVYFNDLGNKAKDFINNSIQDKYDDKKRKLKFLTNDKYQIDFEETVLKKISFDENKNISKDFGDNKYLQNAHYIKKFLGENINEFNIDINNFVEWFFTNIVLTVIICPNQDTAIQIFTVLNDRGMPLSPIDILKSRLMQKLDTKEDRNAFNSKWEQINSDLTFSNFDIDSMLNTYLYFKLTTNPKSRLDKELIQVFDKEGKNSLEIVKEISDFSKSYISILNKESKYIYCLKYLRHKIYWNSILVTANFVNYKEIEKLEQFLVAYYYQNWIAGATIARIKQTSFKILGLVKKGAPISDIENVIKETLENYGTTNTFKDEIKGENVYGRNWDKAILLLVEYFLSDDSMMNFIPINPKLHLEHILPQTPTTDWIKIFNEEEIRKVTNSLPNLTLLSMRKNIQAKNYSFENKVEAYENKDNVISAFEITKNITKLNNWTMEEINKRRDFLIDNINKRIDIFN